MRRNLFQFDEHALAICQTALPHVNIQTQTSMNVILKVNDLVNSIRDLSYTGQLSAMELNEEPPDVEELLTNLKPVCNRQEADFVDMMLNVLSARKLYQAYQDFNEQVQAAQVSEEDNNHEEHNTSYNRSNGPFGSNNNTNMMEFLMSQLAPEQRNMFEMMSMLMTAMQQTPENNYNYDTSYQET